MSYENLSNEELIKLLNEKDKTISDITTKLEDSYEHIEHFLTDKHYEHDIMDSLSLDKHSTSDIDFDELTIETEDEDNSSAVNSASKTFSDIIDYTVTINDEIFSFRENKFKEAIDDLTYCLDNKIPYDIDSFNFHSYMQLEYSHNSRYSDKSRASELYRFVGRVSLEDLSRCIVKDEHLFDIFDTAQSSHLIELEKLVKNLLSEKPILDSFKSLSIKEREDKIIKKFPTVASVLALKEKNEILRNLNDDSNIEITNKKRI